MRPGSNKLVPESLDLGNAKTQKRVNSPVGFEALFDFATEGILVTNQLGEIIKINRAAEFMFGYGKGELLGQKIETLIPRKYSEKHVRHRQGFEKSPNPRSMGIGMDLHGLKKDGTEFPVEVSLSPFESENGKYVIAFIIDITIRRKQDDLLKKSNQELKYYTTELESVNTKLENRVRDRTLILEEAMHELERSRLELSLALEREKELGELKSRFVSMASHEFRTPLTTILSSLSLISKYTELGDTDKQNRHIQKIKASVTSLTDLLNDVLSVSKLEEGKVQSNPEPFTVSEVVNEILETLQTIVKPGQKISYTRKGDEIITLDKKILKHILLNLISNALKFSGDNAEIKVKTLVKNNCLTLTVSDNGIGISEEDQKHLFERFFRGKNVTNIQGTGLGLNIVAQYVKLLNGNIEVKSKLNNGTTFTIDLFSSPAHAIAEA